MQYFRLVRYRSFLPILGLFLLAACSDNGKIQSQSPTPLPEGQQASARLVSQQSDLLQGPLARGTIDDFVLENDRLRVIIQRPGRRWFGVGSYGGNIIDASARNDDGTFNPDHMEEFVTGINIENTPNYTEVGVVNDGSNGEAASICASGPDDLLDYINASSQIRGLGFPYPDEADDRDLPVEIETCYTLAAAERFVTMATTVRNTSSEEVSFYWVEYLNGSGQVEAFQPQVGFGESLNTPACPADKIVSCAAGSCDPCNYLAYSGVDGAEGVSYGMIHDVPASTSLSTSGVNVLILGRSVLGIIGGEAPNFTVPANGELELTRYFAVGDGTASSIGDIRNELFDYSTGELSGVVRSQGTPLPRAQVAVYQVMDATTEPPTLFMAGHAHTDAEGGFSMTLPPGDYELRANKEGYLFDPADPGTVTIAAGSTVSHEFDLPQPGTLQVTVNDQVGPVPAKLQLVGFDPSAPQRNNVNAPLAGDTGVFGDVDADNVPYGIALVDFIGRDGVSDTITVEPGDYQLVISRGPRYSVYKELITIESGAPLSIDAQVVKIIDDSGFVHADFHVHAIDSPDTEVTRRERVEVYLAEGMDFFTPSDHDIRVDFGPTLVEMGVTDLLGTATSSETTTFDYGHFNSWPTTVDPNVLGGGSVDWGREAQPGMDFPEYASYVLSPQEVIDALLDDPMENIVQINHINSHFSAGGLAIDTGAQPPLSYTELSQRRLDPDLGNAFDDGFDSLEVWIGTNGRGGIEGDFITENAGDWFNLINQDIVRTGVANSDSHDRRFTRIGARNLVASDIADPGSLSGAAEQLAATVKAGKSIGTNALFMTVEASGDYMGVEQAAGLRLEDETTMSLDAGGSVEVTVRVAAPAWAQLDSIEFYINNQPAQTSAPPEARYEICPNAVASRADGGWVETQVDVAPGVEGATRTEVTLTRTLSPVTEDTWIVVIARGNDGISEPLFPVLPASLDEESNTTLADLVDGNLGEGGTPAFAFSNPLFIDIGGDGWTGPGVSGGTCLTP